MALKGSKSTKAESKAGSQNLANYRKKNPRPALKHGAWSVHTRERYSDGRTREGKALAVVIQGLVDDLGGPEGITQKEQSLLDFFRTKLMVILQISQYVDEQKSIINAQGELIPCLGRGFTTYVDSAERTLDRLFPTPKKKARSSYTKALEAIQGGKA